MLVSSSLAAERDVQQILATSVVARWTWSVSFLIEVKFIIASAISIYMQRIALAVIANFAKFCYLNAMYCKLYDYEWVGTIAPWNTNVSN